MNTTSSRPTASRRNFLKSTLASSAAISLSGSLPSLLLGASRQSQRASDEKILVVVQMSGGNDGLNTIVPYGDDEYYKNRFTLAVNRPNVLKIDDHIGFNPALRGFNELMENGNLSVVQGVGYPNPNRSHFESMDLWHTAHQFNESSPIGWLGKTVDRKMAKNDLPAVHFGRGLQPLALKTANRPVPSIRSIDNFRLDALKNETSQRKLSALIQTPRKTENSLLSYIHESANVALETSHRLDGLSNDRKNEFDYPETNLGRNLGVIGKLIGSGLSTRIYYTSLDGFDTHSNQGESHSALLTDLGDSIRAFMNQMKAQGNADRVVLFSFSEFGRRVRENASRGTDHGTAAPVFVCGSGLQKGVIGKHPSLTDLDQGDLKFKIDYRSVYADLLENWMGIEPHPIIGKSFKNVGLFETA